ncbi:hypothetical protein DXG03_005024 [Asterophora parasitica]|uniref:Uncharacterized protein n=1 Tax=Asterophora parasitica TaxID=117018 RepID=A0A9P7GEU3_9AGAR|nr:hypothetical protein DXG03_005024 [Asterophora parasitica]
MATTTSAARSADIEYLVRNAMNTGYQIASLLAPPVYAGFVLTRRGRGSVTTNRLLRATWLGGLAGTAGSGGLAYAWYSSCSEQDLRSKRLKAAYDTDRVRAEDHATIGAVLFSVLTPGIFWKRANVLNLVLGGAGLGNSIGLLIHYGRSLTGDPPPKPDNDPVALVAE